MSISKRRKHLAIKYSAALSSTRSRLFVPSQDVEIPEQIETAEPAAQVVRAATPEHRHDGVASALAARKELADGKMTTRSAPYDTEEAAATNDAASTTAAEDSDAAFRRTQSDTELVRPYALGSKCIVSARLKCPMSRSHLAGRILSLRHGVHAVDGLPGVHLLPATAFISCF